MNASDMKIGKLYIIDGGRGIMQLLELGRSDSQTGNQPFGRFYGHGPRASNEHWGHWFALDRVVREATPEIVLKERVEADARNVGCNNPDCWCRKYGRVVTRREP